jgi:hypothetical protein
MKNLKKINQLTIKYTCSIDFQDLVDAKGNFRPTLRCLTGLSEDKYINANERRELTTLANAYDAFQLNRNDNRRAFRC